MAMALAFPDSAADIASRKRMIARILTEAQSIGEAIGEPL